MIVLKFYVVIAVVTAIILSAEWLRYRRSYLWCPYWVVILASLAWPVTAGVLIGHFRDKYRKDL